ncbi:MAG: MFS transporter [Candidatus Limnocylindrales bacterium]
MTLPPTRPIDDRPAALVVVFGFSASLGVGTLAIPLLAIDAGYDLASVGFLVATAAAAQLGTRLGLPWLLGRFRDRALIGASSLMMATAFGLLLFSTALPVFVAGQLLQGAARAIFWTSSQTHAVRGPGKPVRRLIDLNVVGSLGTLTGPALAGSLAVLGLPVAIAAAGFGAVLAAVGSTRLIRLPAFDRARSEGSLGLLRRPGVDVACWASVVGGAWWSMMGSFVPVILVGAGIGPWAIGWLISASEGAGMTALIAMRNVSPGRVPGAVRMAAAGAGIALAALAMAPPMLPVYAVLLVLGGAASGTVTTLAPAMASLAAGSHEQGDALALSGTFRAGALFGTPALVGGLLSIVTLAPALVIVAGGALLPGLAVGRRR